jgi:hypothetical protein
MPSERHTTFFELMDALASTEHCAICLLCAKRARGTMDALFYENVNDPTVRAHLHDSLGFGAEGSRLAVEIHDMLGLSIIYAALAADVRERLAGDRPKLSPERSCPLDENVRETEARFVAVLADHYGETDVQERHAAGFGFCLGHLAAVLGQLTDRVLRRRLVEVEKQKFTRLAEELNLFVAKSDYQHGTDGSRGQGMGTGIAEIPPAGAIVAMAGCGRVRPAKLQLRVAASPR